ncbi:MAG: T9SS type A sorting domain-containing protein [Bacteroidales bacterium]|nr:T9SS type A sorting domain-containing protein [Bacteroidales bacterium]
MKHGVLKRISFQLLVVLAGVTFTLPAHAQDWLKNLPQNKVKNHTLTLRDYQAAFMEHWNEYALKEKKAKEENELLDENYEKFKRWEWYWETRVDFKTGTFPTVTAYDVYKQYLQTHPRTKAETANAWTSIGPSKTLGGYAGLGRINCVAFSPVDTNTLYVGSASGGIWKTTNLGATWTPTGDFNNALGVAGLVVVNTGGQDIVYLATGDKDHYDTYSVGVLKSTDGGNTWNKTGLTWRTSQHGMVYKLLLDPNNNNTLYAASNGGLFKTTDGANTWTRINTLIFRDIEFQPGSSSRMIASTNSGGIYYSKDAGAHWTQSVNLSSEGRTELAVTPDSNNVVYAVMSNASNYGLYGIYKSVDTGVNFKQIPDTLNLLGWNCKGDDTGGQGWYDLTIAADPDSASKVFVGGVNDWYTQDGGKSWHLSNHWSSNCSGETQIVHADKHDIVFQKATHALFECNDGGIYKSNDGLNWKNIGNGLVTSQIYRIGLSKTVAGEVVAGLQDNGTKLLYGGNWRDVYGGDGLDCLIDYTNDSIQYGEAPNGSLVRTKNRWSTATDITSGLPSSGAWLTPFVIDPVNHKTLFTGFSDVYKTTNQGDSWTKVSNFQSTSTIRSMAIAPSNHLYVYAATQTKLYQSQDGGNSWKDITGSLPVDLASITNIAVNYTQPGTVWVTFGGYNNIGVYETQNSGVSWNDISDGLPAIPIDCIVQNKLKDTTQIYAGTDVGVFVRQGNSQWVSYMDQLPNVVVNDLEIQYDNNGSGKLYAGTFGRGLWNADLFSGYIAPVTAANFEADATSPLVGDTVRFTDLSNNSPTSWKWHFVPATVTYLSNTDSTSENPVVKFNAAGYYSVTLASTGSTTLTKTISSYILAEDRFKVTVTANRTEVCKGDTTQLFASVSGGSGNYKFSWSSKPLGFSSSTQNPVITPANDTTSYTVAVLDGNNSTIGSIIIYRVTCTGISNNEAVTGRVEVFPNPSNGLFTVSAEKTIENVELLNQNGVTVYSENVNAKKAMLNIRLPRGMYFVKVTLAGENQAQLISLLKLLIW